MYNPVETTFPYEGSQYVVKRQPRRFWPCQSCDLYETCAEHYHDTDFPKCRRQDREDNTDVVFFKTFNQPRGRAPRRENTDAQAS